MDKEVLAIDDALDMVGGERPLLRLLLDGLVNDRPLDERHLRLLMAAGKNVEAAQYVHYYKGAGRQVGALLLGDTGQTLEDTLRGKASGDLRLLADDFTRAYRRTIAAARQALESLAARPLQRPPQSSA